jgi:hypothetical protein
MIDGERAPFLHNAPVHIDFLRTLDELEALRPPQRTETFGGKPSLPYEEERRAWHKLDLSGSSQAG